MGAFGTFPLLYDTWFRTGQIVAINAKVHATKSLGNFSERLHPIHPIGPLNSCFGAFHSARVHLGMFRYGSKLIGKRVEVTLEFFATNALDPPHWILNSCFVAFLSVWVHLGPFSLLHETRCKMD